MLADAFHLGAAAQDAEDRILYDQATGSLYYDPDGIGAAAAVKFAVVATRKALTLSDFYVI
jgi:serralysin